MIGRVCRRKTIPAIDRQSKRLLPIDQNAVVDKIPVAGNVPGIPLLSVAVLCGVIASPPEQHLRTVGKILVGEVFKLQLAVLIVFGIKFLVAFNHKWIEMQQCIAPGDAPLGIVDDLSAAEVGVQFDPVAGKTGQRCLGDCVALTVKCLGDGVEQIELADFV